MYSILNHKGINKLLPTFATYFFPLFNSFKEVFMKILRTYIKENIGILSLGAIFLTLNTFATLAIPFQISNIINLGIMKKDIDMVYSTSIKMVIILIVGTATGIIANHFVALFATNFTKKNRKLLIRNLES